MKVVFYKQQEFIKHIIEKGELPWIEIICIPEINSVIEEQTESNYYYRPISLLASKDETERKYVIKISKEHYRLYNDYFTYNYKWKETE